jgi:hypothetical protein
MMIEMRNRHHQARHYHLWDVVATLAAVLVGQAAAVGATGAGAEDPAAAAVLVHHGAAATVGRAGAGVAEDTQAQAQASKYSPQFLTYVDQVIDDLVRVHNAFWTEGQWYNMTLKSENPIFGLFYDRPGAVQVITDPTDPTGIYGK